MTDDVKVVLPLDIAGALVGLIDSTAWVFADDVPKGSHGRLVEARRLILEATRRRGPTCAPTKRGCGEGGGPVVLPKTRRL